MGKIIALTITICALSIILLTSVAFAVQRMGLMERETCIIAPKQNRFIESRCLDEYETAPTTDTYYTKVLSNNPEDITVSIGNNLPIPLEKAIRDRKVSITGYSSPDVQRAYIDNVIVNNLTDSTINIHVHSFTPIGTSQHSPFGYDVSKFSGLSQRDIWDVQSNPMKLQEHLTPQQKRALEDKNENRSIMQVAENVNKVYNVDEWLKSLQISFIMIRSDSFIMGSKDKDGCDIPSHSVEVKSFQMMSTEVTQLFWTAVMGNNPSEFKGVDLPVDNVSWIDCQEFIKRMNQRDPGKGYRLPCECEWEYACRAASITRYYWGDIAQNGEIGNFAWYEYNSQSQTHPVGKRQSNAWGLYDMSGNVWEWCEDDWHADYVGAPIDGSAWTENPRIYARVLRGGSWFSKDSNIQCTSRSRSGPDYHDNNIGFRLVRNP
jgi:formylglycine-generating enzyme required for sulfatase activity